MAEDHTCKGVGECHPYREFEGMQPSRQMQTSLASATGVSPWVSTQAAIAQGTHPDTQIHWRLEHVEGVFGGIAGFRQVQVTIVVPR